MKKALKDYEKQKYLLFEHRRLEIMVHVNLHESKSFDAIILREIFKIKSRYHRLGFTHWVDEYTEWDPQKEGEASRR